MNTEELKNAMREVMREVMGEFFDKLSTGKEGFFENLRSMEKLSTTPVRPEARIELAMGQWLVPDEVRKNWDARFPGVNVDHVLRNAAAEINRGKSPGRHGYKRWLESRLRFEYHRRGVDALRAGADTTQRATLPCEGDGDTPGSACARPAIFSMLIGNARKNFCSECADVAHAADMRRRVTGR